MIERSVSIILGILGNLGHFRHSFIVLYQSVMTRGERKDKYDKVELICLLHALPELVYVPGIPFQLSIEREYLISSIGNLHSSAFPKSKLLE